MKIAVTAQGNEMGSKIDPRFGRAKYLIKVDTDSGDFEVVDNEQNLNAAQGAGVQAGMNVANMGVEAVVTANVGPKAFRTLQAAGVKIFLVEGEGNVGEAVEAFKSGSLKEVGSANVEGHW